MSELEKELKEVQKDNPQAYIYYDAYEDKNKIAYFDISRTNSLFLTTFVLTKKPN
jgi:hypothetical protein